MIHLQRDPELPLFAGSEINSPFLDSTAHLQEYDRLVAVQEHLDELVASPLIGVSGILAAIENRRNNLSDAAKERLGTHRHQLMHREWVAVDPDPDDESYMMWLHSYHSTGTENAAPGFRHVRDTHGHDRYVAGLVLERGYMMDTWDEPIDGLVVPRPDLDSAFKGGNKDEIEELFATSDKFMAQFTPNLNNECGPGTSWKVGEGAHRLSDIQIRTRSLIIGLRKFRNTSPIYSDPGVNGRVETQHILSHTSETKYQRVSRY